MDRKQIIKEHKNDTVQEFKDYLLDTVCFKRGPCKVRDDGYRCSNCSLSKHLFYLIDVELGRVKPKHITQLNDRKPSNQRLFNRF